MRIGSVSPLRRRGREDLGGQVVLHGLERRLEELGLRGEVVVQGTPADRGLAQDLLGRRGRETLLREEATGRHDQATPSRLGAFCLRGHGVTSTRGLQTDSWYVTMKT